MTGLQRLPFSLTAQLSRLLLHLPVAVPKQR